MVVHVWLVTPSMSYLMLYTQSHQDGYIREITPSVFWQKVVHIWLVTPSISNLMLYTQSHQDGYIREITPSVFWQKVVHIWLVTPSISNLMLYTQSHQDGYIREITPSVFWQKVVHVWLVTPNVFFMDKILHFINTLIFDCFSFWQKVLRLISDFQCFLSKRSTCTCMCPFFLFHESLSNQGPQFLI